MIKFTEHQFDNGLRLLLAPMRETQAVTILFVYGVGSRYETKPQNGLAHFLEHMFFKGTAQRPTTLDISQELDSLGAEYNAYTSEETTGYYISAAAEHFPVALDVLTDMLYNSKFAAEEIQREKGVICEEIKMYADNPMSYLDEVAKRLLFGDTPLGRDIAGKPNTVRSFSRADFLNYQERCYGPANTILVIAGNPKRHDWLTMASASLSHIKGAKAPRHEKQALITDTLPVSIGYKPIDQVHLSLMHYGVDHRHPDVPIFEVMSNILGGTMSSRLFVQIRERRGLAYYVRSHSANYNDIGSFDCSAGVDPKKLPEALAAMVNEINQLAIEPVSDIELKRAKQNIKGRLSLRLEDSHSIARYLAYEELEMGAIRQPEEYLEQIEKVTQSDIMKVANRYLGPDRRKLAIVGPLKADQQAKLTKLVMQ